MPADPSNRFQSVLSACIEKFLQEKHACGYDYHEPTRILQRFDDFLVQEGLTTEESDTPRVAGGLVSGAASKAVVPLV
jgi:hypothetical protein